MRSFAIARTSEQLSKIRADLALLGQDPHTAQETHNLLADIEAILAADADRGNVPELPSGVTGDAHFGKALEEQLFGRRFHSKIGILSSHYDDCYKNHTECAYSLGVFDALHHALQTPATRKSA